MIKGCIKLCFILYEPKKVLDLLFKYGLTSQNKKSVAESLNEIEYYIREHGSDMIKTANYK